jgi:hypothetical protein
MAWVYSSYLWQDDSLLLLVFAFLICIGNITYLIGLEEQDLGNTLISVNSCRERGGVGYLQGDIALPFGFEWRDVDDDATTGVCGFP